MQTLNFTQQLVRKSRFFRSLIPLAALLVVSLGIVQEASAQQQFDNSITLTQQPTGASSQSVSYAGKRLDAPYDSYTQLGNANASPPVAAPQLGTYDLNATSRLVLTGGAIVVAAPGRGTTITGAQAAYRVYLSGTATASMPAYSPMALPFVGLNSFGDRIYQASGGNIDFLNSLTSGGTYTIDIRFQLSLSDGTTSEDPSSSYSLNFYVTPPPFTPAGGTTTWIGTNSTDWNLASNWSNGVPTGNSNAVINDPSIIRYTYPVLDSPLGGVVNTYAVNNLTLNGVSSTVKAELFVQLAILVVNGNIRQPAGGLRGVTTGNVGVVDATQNSTLILAGTDQVITGQLSMPDIVVSGSGIKSVINVLLPTNTLSFRPGLATTGVILQTASEDNVNNSIVTVFNTTGNTYVDLRNNGIISQVAGSSETNTSYVKGVLRSTRRLTAGTLQAFGNIGIEMTPNHSPTGQIVVTRVLGEAQQAPVGNGVAIKRLYTISGDDDSEASVNAGYGSYVRFRYLDSSTELNSISEANLLMFLSFNIGGPYAPIYGDLQASSNYYDRSFLSSYPAYNLTLGDRTRPLPVTLTAFDAKRTGSDALVTWQTATEENNKGYNIQVSTDGVEFRTLAFVASASTNSSGATNYSYIDTEKNKVGLRYYRLQQVDIDGKATYFAPRTVSFEGKAVLNSGYAYPNPFTSEVSLNLTSAVDGKASVNITDMAGRTVSQRQISLTNGSNDVLLSNLGTLKGGIYLMHITLPSGEVQNLKVVKQ